MTHDEEMWQDYDYHQNTGELPEYFDEDDGFDIVDAESPGDPGPDYVPIHARCPRCGVRMEGPTTRHALSRRLDIYISDDCGMKEALEDAGLLKKLPLMKWAAIEEPQNGGGAWKD